MAYLKKLILLTLFTFICFHSIGQNEIDSLQQVLNNATTVEGKIKAKIDIATIYRKWNIDSLKKYGLSALYESKKIGNKLLQCDSYFALAGGYSNSYITKVSDTVWMYLDSAEVIANKTHDKYRIALANYYRGTINYLQNNFSECVKYLLKADDQFSLINDTEHLARIKHVISCYYATTGEYEKGLKYSLEAYPLFEELNQTEDLIYSMMSLSDIYLHLNDTINTTKWRRRCYTYSMKYGQPDDKVSGAENLAILFYLLNQDDSAIYYYNQSIQLANYPGSEKNLYATYGNLARIYFKNGDLTLSEKYFLKALNNKTQIGSPRSKLKMLSDLSDLYYTLGNYKKSLTYLQKYQHLKDSLKLSQASALLDQALADKELTERINELTLLKKQQSSMVTKVYLLGICAFLLIIIYYSFWYYHRYLYYKNAKRVYNNRSDFQSGTIWSYSFPKKQPKQWMLFISAIIYMGIVYILYLFAFTHQVSILPMAGAALVGVLFFIAFKLIQISPMALKKEVTQSLIVNFTFIILSLALFLIVSRLSVTSQNILYLLMIICIANFAALLAMGMMNLRESSDLFYQNIIDGINEKINVHSSGNELVSHLKQGEPVIQIDDLSITIDNVLFIVSDNVYQEFICVENGKIEKKLTRKTLAYIEKELELYPSFIRCHRSYIVNLNKVKEVRGNSRQQYLILESTSEKIPVSRSQASEILLRYESFNRN
ncbi:MAG: tetratricopeptide repeat protein [Bacteroidales bacterium]